jgi:hypothetical protein
MLGNEMDAPAFHTLIPSGPYEKFFVGAPTPTSVLHLSTIS